MKIEKLSKKQFKIFSFAVSPVPFLICDGAVRSGKTVCMGAAFLMWAMDQFDRTNFAICGKTVANAERNVLAPLLNVENLPYLMRYNRAERKLICRCGSRENYFYLFGGKDESSYTLIQGITLAGVLLDEVALMPRSFVDQAMARTLTYQNAKVWFNCNPEGQLHWFNQEWIIPTDRGQRKATHLHFLMSDNPILGPEELSKAEAMFSGVFYDRYIRGLWVAAEGPIYDMFSRERHILDALPATEGVYYVSCDYGTQNPTVFLLWRKERGADRWICEQEYYYSGRQKRRQKTDGEFADDLSAWLGEKKPRAIIVDPSAASFIAELRQRGHPVQKADNDVLNGIRTVGQLLKAGLLGFSRQCNNTIAEFGAYVWDEKASQRGEDKPVKDNDHCMDAVRYFVSTVLSRNQVRVGRRPKGL